MKISLWLLIVFGAIAVSCDNSTTEPQDYYSYYPLQVGNYLIYDVREETYSAGKQEPSVSVWQEKDQIVERKETGDNTISWLITRFTRSKATDYWTKTKEYLVTSAPDKILTNVDNETFLSLIFPVDLGIEWNGNTYNTRDREQYAYNGLNEPYDKFDRTLTVVERSDSSIINKYVGIKKYALNVGLIYDDQTSYEYCQTDECLESDTRKVESGFHRIRRITDYGKL